MPSEAQREELDAWTKCIGDSNPERDRPLALVGRGAAAFARFQAWMARDEGFHADVLPWDAVLGNGLSVPNLELAVFVGDHVVPVNRSLWKALCDRTRVLVGSRREPPAVFPLGKVLRFNLDSRLAANLGQHVDGLFRRVPGGDTPPE